ncbi:hypothetical protein KY290_037981 [Solanum tuberosum]|uniref:Secreted protein n=1 Tax=Solanum tuberosum TaxID=4113 RepID=A0ABQ7TYR3_SOLTU|nr:hypothetical protein KY284_037345 [Solanum tuberosum]KAH0640749.1 hypothetical protein KY285_037335 [Solanum tuberosum]KAH0739276.1 hypothetical protein KY290_037981 [Solanum tuberosum]
MGFAVTSLIFVVVGVIASFGAGICCNRGPSTNFARIGGQCPRHLVKGGGMPTIPT